MLVIKGKGLVNSLINKLPVELHLPGYQYCGPGTKLAKRLERGDPGINELDRSCKEHDIAYSRTKDLKERHKADEILENKAWARVKASDASLGEKASAWFVTNAMKVKRKLGMSLQLQRKNSKKKKPQTQTTLQKAVLKKLKKQINDVDDVSTLLKTARVAVKKAGGKKRIRIPRIIPLPKIGGILPILPAIFAGLSAIGAISGGAAGIAKAINDAKAAKKALEESERHNKQMEAIAIGKQGDGLYLMKHLKGYGLFLKKFRKNFQ